MPFTLFTQIIALSYLVSTFITLIFWFSIVTLLPIWIYSVKVLASIVAASKNTMNANKTDFFILKIKKKSPYKGF